MTGNEMARLAEALVPVAQAAGREQLRHWRADTAVETKADASPVTIADRNSEAIILDELARLLPGVAVIAEEAAAAGRYQAIGSLFALVDPLDGTKEFIAGHADFTVNFALIEAGVPVLGLVYAPALGRLYVTRGPGEAIEMSLAADETCGAVAARACKRLAARRPPASGMVALVSRSHMNAATEAVLAGLPIAARRAVGSSLKFCLIAAGEGDVYPRVGPTHEWDTAAGHAVVQAAGGRVTALDGAPLRYGNAAGAFRNPDYVAWGRPAG